MANQPTNAVPFEPVVPRPSASIFSMSAAVSRVPLRTTTSLRAILTTIGSTAASTRSFSWFGQLLAERRVRDDEVADQFGGKQALRGVEPAGHEAGQARLRGGDLGVEEFGAQDRIEDARGFGPDRRPAVTIESGERGGGRLGQVRQRGLEQGRALLGRHLGLEDRVDPRHVPLERERLFGGDGDRLLAGEVVHGIDVVAGLLACRRGLDVAVELDRDRRDDVGRDDVAGLEGERLLRQEVGPEDRGQDEDEDPGGDGQARRVIAREARDRDGPRGQHGISGSRRRGRRGRPARGPGRRARSRACRRRDPWSSATASP